MIMARSRLPKSIRKYLRRTKAQIREQAVDREEADRSISALVAGTRAKFPSRPA
jgi:hypothetical protein